MLILAPEAYLPLREVGARFHASMEGVAAAEQVFAVLERPGRVPVRTGRTPPPCPAGPIELRFDDVRLTHPERTAAALDGVDLAVPRGPHAARSPGPAAPARRRCSRCCCGSPTPTAGRITVERRRTCATCRSSSGAGGSRGCRSGRTCSTRSVADNVRLGVPDADDEAVARAVALARGHDVVAALPDGYATRLGERGTRLSAGQRQRIALARAFLRRMDGASLVLLDEPTAHLDPDNAAAVRAGVARLLDGATGIVVAHDAGLGGPCGRGGPPGGGPRSGPAGALGSGPMSAAAAVQEPDERPVRPRSDDGRSRDRRDPLLRMLAARPPARGPVRPRRARRARRRPASGVGLLVGRRRG